MLKSYRVWCWGGGGGPCDFSVSPSSFGLDFGTLDFGTSDLGLGLTIKLRLMPYKVILFLAPTGAQGEAMERI